MERGREKVESKKGSMPRESRSHSCKQPNYRAQNTVISHAGTLVSFMYRETAMKHIHTVPHDHRHPTVSLQLPCSLQPYLGMRIPYLSTTVILPYFRSTWTLLQLASLAQPCVSSSNQYRSISNTVFQPILPYPRSTVAPFCKYSPLPSISRSFNSVPLKPVLRPPPIYWGSYFGLLRVMRIKRPIPI